MKRIVIAAAAALGYMLCAILPASAHSDGCSRRGDVAGINCQLARWVHCSGGAQRATSFNASGRTACGLHGNVVALPHAASRGLCGQQITVTNAANGRSTIARIGDSGPATIAAIDLSYTTASIIGVHGSGCVHIGGMTEVASLGDSYRHRERHSRRSYRARRSAPIMEVSAQDNMTMH